MESPIVKQIFQNSSVLCNRFRTFFSHQFDNAPLEELHLVNILPRFQKGTDQSSNFHKLIYQEFDRGLISPIVKSYRQLAYEWLLQLKTLGIDNWAIQRFPSVRIHFPNNLSVFEFHRDSTYSHHIGEVNHFLSITRSQNTAALQIEQHLGWQDYKPLNLSAGQSAIINTSIFEHGDFINQENFTRVSIDFRALPLHCLESSQIKKSLTKGKVFDTTDYFIDSRSLFEL